MNNLLEHYETVLSYLREQGLEFASKHPVIAGRLSGQCSDPHVERLVEAFAFLAARIDLKLEDQFSEVTQALLSLLYPHYLRPVPPMAIAQFDTDPAKARFATGHQVARGTSLESRPVDGVACSFRTAYPVELWPLRIDSASFQRPSSDVPGLSTATSAVIRLELSTAGGVNLGALEKFDRLRFHLAGEPRVTHAVYELLMSRCAKVIVRRQDGQSAEVKLHEVGLGNTGESDGSDDSAPTAFGQESIGPNHHKAGMDEAIPYGAQSFAGFRLLQEYFGLPEKFLFFDVSGLGFVRGTPAAERFELCFAIGDFERKDRFSMLQTLITVDTFRLACTPIVNLVDMPSEPLALCQKHSEYRIVASHGRDSAYEVYSINRVTSLSEYGKGLRVYEPFYSFRHAAPDRHFWFATRRPSHRKGDLGTDVYLAFVDLDFGQAIPPEEYVTARLTCTNRDLASKLSVQSKFGELTSAKDLRARYLAPLTPARRAPLSGELQWRLISHMALNSFSVARAGRPALSEILALYDFSGDGRDVHRQIEGLQTVESSSSTVPLFSGIGVSFCRGTAIELTFDEERFSGGSAFLLASVLERFLGLMAPVNSFSQVTARTLQREGPIKQWKPRSGTEILH